MIEIEDLKKVKLEENDLLIFQISDSNFHKRSYREWLSNYLRSVIKQNFLFLPADVKVGVINGNIAVRNLTIDNSSDDIEIKPIFFDPDNLSIS